MQGIDTWLDSPWSQFVVDRAQTRANWWGGAQSDYLENTSDLLAAGATARESLNLSLTTFATTSGAAQRSHAEQQATASETWLLNRTRLGRDAANDAIDALKSFQLDTAAAVRDHRTSRADVNYELVIETSSSAQAELEAELLALDVSLSSARTAASNTLRRSETSTTGTLRVGLAGADRDFLTSSIGHDRALLDLLNDNLGDFTASSSNAIHTRNLALAEISREGLLGLSGSYGDAIGELAQNNPTPWAQKDADQYAAAHGSSIANVNAAVALRATTSAAERDRVFNDFTYYAQKSFYDFENGAQQEIAEITAFRDKTAADAAVNNALAQASNVTQRTSDEATPGNIATGGTISTASGSRYFTEHNAPASGSSGHVSQFPRPLETWLPIPNSVIAPDQAQSLPNGQVDPSRPPQPPVDRPNSQGMSWYGGGFDDGLKPSLPGSQKIPTGTLPQPGDVSWFTHFVYDMALMGMGDNSLIQFVKGPKPVIPPAREQARSGKFLDKAKAASAPAHEIPPEIDVFAPGQGPLARTKESWDIGNWINVAGNALDLTDYVNMSAADAMKIRGEAALGMAEGVYDATRETFNAVTDPVGTVTSAVTGFVYVVGHPNETASSLIKQAADFAQNATPRDIGRQFGKAATYVVGGKAAANFSEAIATKITRGQVRGELPKLWLDESGTLKHGKIWDAINRGKKAIDDDHFVEWELFGPRGGKLGKGEELSGVDFAIPKGVKLTFPEQAWYGHTEGKIISELSAAGKLGPGRLLTLGGTLPPCKSCRDILKWASQKFKMSIEYIDEDGIRWFWKDGVALDN